MSVRHRIVAGVVLVAVIVIFVMLWAGATGRIASDRVFGVCGFKQRHGLPCAGCYWTTAAGAFATGHVLRAFYIQPAAAMACCALVATAFCALLIAVFGVQLQFLQALTDFGNIKYIVVCVIVVILAGWAVTLTRALAERL